MNVEERRKIESKIVRRVIRSLLKQGLFLNVYNGGEGHELPKPSKKFTEIVKALFATDDEYLMVARSDADNGQAYGYVRLIYGNDGWDVIADYSSNLEKYMGEINAYVDEIAATI